MVNLKKRKEGQSLSYQEASHPPLQLSDDIDGDNSLNTMNSNISKPKYHTESERSPLLESNDALDVGSTPAARIGETSQPSSSFPLAVFFIIGNEFCERFSFYGMKTILYLYLKDYLGFNGDNATAILHLFVMGAYFFPLVGGTLSDSYLGKYKTIVYLSIIYALGNIVVAVTAIPGVTGDPPHWWGAAVGLFFLAVGTGGIKPCVSAFGGDQFEASQTREIGMFFSAFYFSINAGSLLSTFITPELRSLSCLRSPVCYPLAFGLPAVLMVVAILVFVMGTKLYKMTPPGGNVLYKVFGVIITALRQKRGDDTSHWLDVATPVWGRETVTDTKKLLRVLFIFLPLPLFWALYDQQSSRWVAQAQLMYRKISVFGAEWTVKPDQMQIVNAFLILLLIPVFDRIIYPLISACGIRFHSLARMTAGMLLTGIAFVMAAALQVSIDKGEFGTIDGEFQCISNCVHVAYQVPQYVVITAGEILFSITGLEFAYAEAPVSMKSVCQAAWLLTVAVGNLVVAVVASSNIFDSVALELMFFAGFIFLAMLVFALMSWWYVRTRPTDDSGEEEDLLTDRFDDPVSEIA